MFLRRQPTSCRFLGSRFDISAIRESRHLTEMRNTADNAQVKSTAITVSLARRRCEGCSGSMHRRSHPTARFCYECTTDRARACRRRRNQVAPDISAAHGVVAKAIRDGFLRPATERLCVDCLRPAEEYDHRDYRYPLEVEPTCHRCNSRRGPGHPYRAEDRAKGDLKAVS